MNKAEVEVTDEALAELIRSREEFALEVLRDSFKGLVRKKMTHLESLEKLSCRLVVEVTDARVRMDQAQAEYDNLYWDAQSVKHAIRKLREEASE